MKQSIPLVVLLPIILLVLPATNARLREFLPGNLRQTDETIFPQQCDGRQFTVCESCDTIKVCISDSANALNPTRRCPAATPFCRSQDSAIGASCSAQPDEYCKNTEVNQNAFVCTGAGFYPDPNSCRVYHYCESKGVQADSYDCPDGYKYNTRTNYCQRTLFPCTRGVLCDPNDRRVFVPYPGDQSYYVFCQYDYTNQTAAFKGAQIFACGKDSTFNENSATCEFRCPRTGMFVNTANPRQYYQCYRVGGRLKYKTNTCRVDQVFDEDERRCVVVPGVTISTTTVPPEVTTTPEVTAPPELCVRRLHFKG
ncbi:AAEL012642-PA [Aedes aegypti]|uniref:AAEL012642-PA n=2 Tax=Aedes aegypti TaxID=7159 RepID=A0A1S4FWT3_AEDAE|nr:uncharacterized protein LOC5576624 [Aedes aegypti]EAT35174.1 AAEL012642-PA [Aedes aegypti]